MNANDAKIAAWRQEKEAEWADLTSKLRTKRPIRADFEAWMDKQCRKASAAKATEHLGRQAWAKGLQPPDLYEWFSNCYQMRCDDDYCWGGGNLHGQVWKLLIDYSYVPSRLSSACAVLDSP